MIVLNSRTEVQPYSFDISLDHLIPEMAEDGSILLKDPDSHEIQFVIPSAFMEDAKGNRSHIHFQLLKPDTRLPLLRTGSGSVRTTALSLS